MSMGDTYEFMDYIAMNCQFWPSQSDDEIIQHLEKFHRSGVHVDNYLGVGSGGPGIYLAMVCDRPKVVEWFIDHGADVNQYVSDAGMSILPCAIDQGMDEIIIRKLLEAGADPNAPEDEEHPLEIAQRVRKYDADEICELLIEYGADQTFLPF